MISMSAPPISICTLGHSSATDLGLSPQKQIWPLHQKLKVTAQSLTHSTEQAQLRLGPFLWPCWAIGSCSTVTRAGTDMLLTGRPPEMCEQQRGLLCCTPGEHRQQHQPKHGLQGCVITPLPSRHMRVTAAYCRCPSLTSAIWFCLNRM